MGKTETIDGVVRGSKSSALRREGGWLPPWEGPFRNEFYVKWDQRTYGFDVNHGCIAILTEEWVIDYKTIPPTAMSTPGSLIVPKDNVAMTFAEACKLLEECRESGSSLRKAFAKKYANKLTGDQRVLLANAPDVYVKEEPRSQFEEMVESPKTEEFWNNL
jgi:hypothetical protein